MKHPVPRSLSFSLRFVVAVTIGLLVPVANASAAGVNQCVECHEKAALPITLGHSFPEWKASSHGKAGVSCDKCHGGDPAKADQDASHAGVLPPDDAKSLVNVAKVAATCGSCHDKEYQAFLSTDHGKPEKTDDERATCLTCHGSMATSLPTPAELRTRCAVCHDKPVEAQAALAVLGNAQIQLYRTSRTIEKTKTVDAAWHDGAMTRFHDLEKSFAKITLEWHTFAMKDVVHDSMNVLKLAKLLDEEARLRAEMHTKN